MYRPKMGIEETRQLSARPKIILFSKTVQDYGNRSADICLVVQAVGQARPLYAIAKISMLQLDSIVVIVFFLTALLYLKQMALLGFFPTTLCFDVLREK